MAERIALIWIQIGRYGGLHAPTAIVLKLVTYSGQSHLSAKAGTQGSIPRPVFHSPSTCNPSPQARFQRVQFQPESFHPNEPVEGPLRLLVTTRCPTSPGRPPDSETVACARQVADRSCAIATLRIESLLPIGRKWPFSETCSSVSHRSDSSRAREPLLAGIAPSDHCLRQPSACRTINFSSTSASRGELRSKRSISLQD